MKYLLAALMMVSFTVTAAEIENSDIGNVVEDGGVINQTNKLSSLGGIGDNNGYAGGDLGSHNVVEGDSIGTQTNTTVNNKSHKPQGYVNGVPLTASPGTCMGSIGGSVSGAAIGISGGKTYLDEECNARANETLRLNQLNARVKMLNNMGFEVAALAMMCQNDEMYAAALAKMLPHEKFVEVCAK